MIIDTTQGTCVLGSNFDRLLTAYRVKEYDDYPHPVVGQLRYLPNNWLLLEVDDEIARYYASVVKKQFGIDLHWRSKFGAHVSIIRGEELPNRQHWGYDEGREVKIWYTHHIFTNGEHWWLNVVCDELADIRTSYGLPTNKRFFHLTIGRT